MTRDILFCDQNKSICVLKTYDGLQYIINLSNTTKSKLLVVDLSGFTSFSLDKWTKCELLFSFNQSHTILTPQWENVITFPIIQGSLYKHSGFLLCFSVQISATPVFSDSRTRLRCLSLTRRDGNCEALTSKDETETEELWSQVTRPIVRLKIISVNRQDLYQD